MEGLELHNNFFRKNVLSFSSRQHSMQPAGTVRYRTSSLIKVIMVNRCVVYWLRLIIWTFGIFLVSSLPSDFLPTASGVSTEYPLHITGFFVLFLLFYRLLQSSNKKTALKGILLSSFVFTLIVDSLFFQRILADLDPHKIL